MGPIIIKYIEAAILLFIALVSDIKSYRIGNKVTLTFMITGFVTNLFVARYEGIMDSLLGLVIPFILLIVLYALRMLGAGDIKLFCALGAIFGAKYIIEIMAYSFISGGIIAIVFIIVRRNARERVRHLCNYFKSIFLTLSFSPYTEFEEKNDNGKFRFAYAVFIGTFFFIARKLLF